MSDSVKQRAEEETKRGRPMDLSRNEVIVQTTLELLAEVGFDALTIEAIAHQAKVGKATIYRRWASKEELVIHAVSSISPFESIIDEIDQTKELREQLVDLLCFCFREEHEVYQQAMTAIGSAMPHNKELEQGLHKDFYRKLRTALWTIIEPYLKENHTLHTEKLDLLADVGPALIVYRLFLVRKSFDRAYIENIADHLMMPMIEPNIITEK
ncbi:TetR/AcrR family transcriptional regulator [Alkalicoccobacillus gibsonii]|uniref:TetR/AcrR family transcriptional regulator n=1 Tax=Alkalicoccobacillus gibsonii TaxID=79881 RepID=UPI0019337E80|nr:TetR/AcrR family transcriptional regulator [Alkalicoccobacillus gibsonii]MBM0066882.1 TetR/AcrR family transcriptional regulator [Alkalicoccobacillus gibsonii]